MADFSSRVRELRKKHGLRQKDLAQALGLAQTTVANYEQKLRFPDERTLRGIADYFGASLDYLLGRTGEQVPAREGSGQEGEADAPSRSAPFRSTPHLSGLAREYFSCLWEAGKEAAYECIRKAIAGGAGIRELYLEVFEPALKEIGRLWSLGEAEVGEERFFTESTQLVMSRLAAEVAAASPQKNGLRCVAFAVLGEHHVIGPRMVADFMEMEGWDVSSLGGNLAIRHALKVLLNRPPNLLALSVTLPENVGNAEELIAAVRAEDSLGSLRVLVGGQAFQGWPDLWRQIGADDFALDAEEAVRAANRLARAALWEDTRAPSLIEISG